MTITAESSKVITKEPCHELVLGKTGSGKTVFSRGALVPAYQERYLTVIIDTKHDPNDKLWNMADVTVDNDSAMVRFLKKGYHVHYKLRYGSEEERWSKFDSICEKIMSSSGKIITYVNEGGDVMTHVEMPFWFTEMLRKGRGKQNFAIVETQRPSTIVHNTLFNNINSFWLFRMGVKDREAVKRWFAKEELERIAQLPPYGYIWTDGDDYTIHGPISMEAIKNVSRRNVGEEPKARNGTEEYLGIDLGRSIAGIGELSPKRSRHSPSLGDGGAEKGRTVSVRIV